MPRTTSESAKSWRRRIGHARTPNGRWSTTCASFSLACSPSSSQRAGSWFPDSGRSTSRSRGIRTGRRCSRRAGVSSSRCSSASRSSSSRRGRVRRGLPSRSWRSRPLRSPCRSSPAARHLSRGSRSCSRSRRSSSPGSHARRGAARSCREVRMPRWSPSWHSALSRGSPMPSTCGPRTAKGGRTRTSRTASTTMRCRVPSGWRSQCSPHSPPCAGGGEGYLGLVSFAWEDAAGGFGRTWSAAAMAWGLCLVAVSLTAAVRRSRRAAVD